MGLADRATLQAPFSPRRNIGRTMRLAVFASGGGTNFQAVLDSIDRNELLDVHPALCLSNREDAGVLQRARRRGIPTYVLSGGPSSEEEVAEDMLRALADAEADFIALAGYMKRVPPRVVSAYAGRMLNIHPALLPAFGGKGMYGSRVHAAVLEHGVRWTGVTVHLVDEHYDTGPIVLQEPVPVMPDDTVESLAARVLEAEHRLYPEAIRLFAEGRIIVDGRRVRILDATDTVS